MENTITIKFDDVCTIDTSTNITSIDISGLDGLKKGSSRYYS